MKYSMYCVKDLKSTCMTPTIDQNDQTAIRNFKFAMNNTDSIMNFSPKDFCLYRIGCFDNEKGEIVGYDPVLLARGEDVVDA